MARISANVGEKVFNISSWHGVNEAPEGQARLKLGEAAVMRNFCVTSGGALKKRPGSRDVAGLLRAYTAHVREGSRQAVVTDKAGGRSLELFPRMEASDAGVIVTAGGGVPVAAKDAGGYKGYYFAHNGRVWRLEECVITPGTGSETIDGGRFTPGELISVASGTEKWTKESGSTFSGTRSLETRPEAGLSGENGAGAVALREAGLYAVLSGSASTQNAPNGTDTGWGAQNVGGYFVKDGVLYRYYGAKTDSCTKKERWKKYVCVRSSYGYTYYTEGDWGPEEYSYLGPNTARVGYSSYYFNSSNGTFTLTGSPVRISAKESGTVFEGGGSTVERRIYTYTGGVGSPGVKQTKGANGPYTGYTTGYVVGSALGTVDVAEGARPEADKGFSYVTAFSSGGVQYTVMRSGQDYYCYAKDTATPVGSYEKSFSFWAYPLAVSPDTEVWYGLETYAEANEGSDRQVRGIWSGFVGGREVLCAACGGVLWELREDGGVWSKISCGEMDTSEDVHMFGFDEKLYILNGKKYLVWDGERLEEVEGYRPLVAVSVEPSGGGTLLENVNRLTAGRRAWFSPDGEATVFQLPEKNIAAVDWVKDLTAEPVAVAVDDGAEVTEARAAKSGGPYNSLSVETSVMASTLPNYTVDLEDGTVTFASPPPKGVNTVEIAWSAGESLRGQVCAMRFAELYNGAQDSRVFLYGDGSNRALYSGLDSDGKPRADYFPDLYEAAVGDANTPITAMIRHYNRLLAFKPDSAWSVGYDTITLVDGTVTAGFTVTPVNRSIGNCADGQAQLVQNRPRTLDGRSVMEWKATSASGITGDQRNAERVSQRVDSSIRQFDLAKARTFYDKFSHEYYVIGEDGTAIVQNLDVDAWYVYTGLDVTCMINYRDELYYGTRDGHLRHFSDKYFSDNGEAIDAYWESGAMSFSEDFRRKYSAMIWVGVKPEDNGFLEVTAQTDRKSDFAVYEVASPDSGAVPEMERIKLKAKKFTYYKLILRNNTADKTATVVSADMRLRGAAFVK